MVSRERSVLQRARPVGGRAVGRMGRGGGREGGWAGGTDGWGGTRSGAPEPPAAHTGLFGCVRQKNRLTILYANSLERGRRFGEHIAHSWLPIERLGSVPSLVAALMLGAR